MTTLTTQFRTPTRATLVNVGAATAPVGDRVQIVPGDSRFSSVNYWFISRGRQYLNFFTGSSLSNATAAREFLTENIGRWFYFEYDDETDDSLDNGSAAKLTVVDAPQSFFGSYRIRATFDRPFTTNVSGSRGTERQIYIITQPGKTDSDGKVQGMLPEGETFPPAGGGVDTRAAGVFNPTLMQFSRGAPAQTFTVGSGTNATQVTVNAQPTTQIVEGTFFTDTVLDATQFPDQPQMILGVADGTQFGVTLMQPAGDSNSEWDIQLERDVPEMADDGSSSG